MGILESIIRHADEYRARRRRLRTYLEIAGLPLEIQKDIGWPGASTGSEREKPVLTRH